MLAGVSRRPVEDESRISLLHRDGALLVLGLDHDAGVAAARLHLAAAALGMELLDEVGMEPLILGGAVRLGEVPDVLHVLLLLLGDAAELEAGAGVGGAELPEVGVGVALGGALQAGGTRRSSRGSNWRRRGDDALDRLGQVLLVEDVELGGGGHGADGGALGALSMAGSDTSKSLAMMTLSPAAWPARTFTKAGSEPPAR